MITKLPREEWNALCREVEALIALGNYSDEKLGIELKSKHPDFSEFLIAKAINKAHEFISVVERVKGFALELHGFGFELKDLKGEVILQITKDNPNINLGIVEARQEKIQGQRNRLGVILSRPRVPVVLADGFNLSVISIEKEKDEDGLLKDGTVFVLGGVVFRTNKSPGGKVQYFSEPGAKIVEEKKPEKKEKTEVLLPH